MIDLRSDTVTLPSEEMKSAMLAAKVGDDVFGEDPTINTLEEFAASLFGKEAGLFCPSGTMTNQIAVKVHTASPGEVICEKNAHVYLYEGGGMAFNAGLSVRLLEGDRGRISAAQVREAINPDNVHFPETQLVCLENTSNKGGGSIYTLESIKGIRRVCDTEGLKLHLDGARIFNALVEADYGTLEMGELFDTVSICLSKGLGAPVGSLLLGSKEDMKKARRIRKILGGGMRQGGFMAAAGMYALKNNVERLKDDHLRAKALGENLNTMSYVKSVLPIDTNIVVFELMEQQNPAAFIQKLEGQGVRAISFGAQLIRMVTHLDFTDVFLEKTLEALHKIQE